jgi:hypothetical protein
LPSVPTSQIMHHMRRLPAVVIPAQRSARAHDRRTAHELHSVLAKLRGDPDGEWAAVLALRRQRELHALEQSEDPADVTLLSARTPDEMPQIARLFRVVQTKKGLVREEFWFDQHWIRQRGSLAFFQHLIIDGWRVPSTMFAEQRGVPSEIGVLDSYSGEDALRALKDRVAASDALERNGAMGMQDGHGPSLPAGDR